MVRQERQEDPSNLLLSIFSAHMPVGVFQGHRGRIRAQSKDYAQNLGPRKSFEPGGITPFPYLHRSSMKCRRLRITSFRSSVIQLFTRENTWNSIKIQTFSFLPLLSLFFSQIYNYPVTII